MGMSEARSVFQAKAKCPVESNMGYPDQSVRFEFRVSGQRRCEQRKRQYETMRGIISGRTRAFARQIAHHGKIGDKKEYCE